MPHRPAIPHRIRLRYHVFFLSAALLTLTAAVATPRAGERASSDGEQDEALTALVSLLGESDDSAFQLDVLQGLSDALEGRRDAAMPGGWRETYERLSGSEVREVRDRAVELALIFRDEQAASQLQATVRDPRVEVEQRRRSLRLLVEHRAAGLQPLLEQQLRDGPLRREALLGLAAYPTDSTPRLILELYPRFDADERETALGTLASRGEFALAMLDAAEQGQVPRTDISTVLARQLLRLEDDKVRQRLSEVWGEIRQTTAQKRELIDEYKRWLTPDFLAAGDAIHGRLLFEKTCQQCHMLYGQGGKIGPDITGSDRANLDYVLENVLDPSAAVPRAYRLSTVVTDDGRVISGLVERLPNGVLAVQTPTERVLVPESDIELLRESTLSMMPDGLFDNLGREQIRDLIYYLGQKR